MSGHDNENIESKLERAARNAVQDGNNANLSSLNDIVPGIDPEIVRGEAGGSHDHHHHHHDSSNEMLAAAAAAAVENERNQQQQQQQGHHQIKPEQQQQHHHPQHQHHQSHQMGHPHQHQHHTQMYPEPSHHGAETSRRRIRLTWSAEETAALIEGCKIHGVGNWKKILTDPNLKFNSRTAVDLKDRFRTSFPEEYSRLYPNAKTHRFRNRSRNVQDETVAMAAAAAAAAAGLDNNGNGPDHRDPATALANVTNDARGGGGSGGGTTGLGVENLVKINRKERRKFTEKEDEMLWEGFKRHGPCWSKIQRDQSLELFNRRSTDLRDRFRNKFPDKYILAGYKGRGAGGSAAAAGGVKKNPSDNSQQQPHGDENTAALTAAAAMTLNSENGTNGANNGTNEGRNDYNNYYVKSDLDVYQESHQNQ